ncbi:hydroxyneurosporene synthase CrtC [Leptospira inadai serovar Lyme str. 10]|uniref:Hydroxyneurosporene synthase CrtC n=2 Tax=Leptospira inadai serovar Lyme TaxID=293084 RepID=V6H993_9LEPT|nr:lipocalin-like domain-containing protein [Leptospira inadai]EQA35671.1 hydroxyneurosporene synthase CrtC [Leptospira inadai serovar Lyme str. 10]PNV76032.1 carotenoid 1,2-hydratase [Leptospira inadai serovar Lyme]
MFYGNKKQGLRAHIPKISNAIIPRIRFSLLITILLFTLSSNAEHAVAFGPNKTLQGRAENGRQFRFPQDHFFHNGFRVEWCYFVGILNTETGKELGYELSFFRAFFGSKVSVYPVHFAISDMNEKIHKTAQGLERELGSLAGQDKRSIWSGDYRMEVLGPAEFRITAFPRQESGFGIELELKGKPEGILLHGNKGKSIKSRVHPEFYSYYYSIPRLETKGTLYLDGKEYVVTSGKSWMDHEWSSPEGTVNTNHLASKENAWDWICIQLDDGSDIMAFNFRSKSGEASETFGTVRNRDGKVRSLEKEGDLRFQPKSKIWKSPNTGIQYALEWTLESDQLSLEINPKFEDQEFDARETSGLIYWEGGISVKGLKDGKPVSGKGYLELKGGRR